MTDLVKRLRDECEDANDPILMTRATLLESADRIEALEKALQSLLDVQNGPPLIRHADEWQSAVDSARAALEGKDGQKV